MIGLMKEAEHDLSPRVFYHQFRSMKRAPRRQVIGHQFTADDPLRVIAEGSAGASPTTPHKGIRRYQNVVQEFEVKVVQNDQ